MYKLKILVAFIASAIIGLSLNIAQHHTSRSAEPVVENTTDPVLDSFLRDFDHKPSPVRYPRRDAIDDDVLYETLNSVHWTRPVGAARESVSIDSRTVE